MEYKPLYFVLPENHDLPTGGNIYNSSLIEALQDKGKHTNAIRWNKFMELWQAQAPGHYWLDTILLDHFKSIPTCNSSKKVSLNLIVHGLPSLFTSDRMVSEEIYQNNEKPLLRLFDKFLVTSSFVKKYLITGGIDSSKIIVVPPPLGITPDLHKKSYPVRGIFKVLLVGNMVPEKGIFPFLKELNKKMELKDDLQLTIIGRDDLDRDYSKACYEIIANNELLKRSIRVRSPVALNKMPAIYREHHLFVAPSVMETYGMAMQEARFSGLPLLGLNVGNVPQQIKSGENGFMLDHLEHLVVKALAFARFPGYFNDIAASAWQNIPACQYSWQEAGGKFLNEWEQGGK